MERHQDSYDSAPSTKGEDYQHYPPQQGQAATPHAWEAMGWISYAEVEVQQEPEEEEPEQKETEQEEPTYDEDGKRIDKSED